MVAGSFARRQLRRRTLNFRRMSLNFMIFHPFVRETPADGRIARFF